MELYGHFNDSMKWDAKERSAISVRDGVLEYLGAELGLEPADKVFTVYRSPATIANTAALMAGIPLTDEHVSLEADVETPVGKVLDGTMIDFDDETSDSKLAIRNRIEVTDLISGALNTGKRELSLGYKAQLVPHQRYDFEQREIMPHHLAVVMAGRCGSACSFIDKKPNQEGETMAKPNQKKAAPAQKPNNSEAELLAVFTDEDGALSLEKIVEVAQNLPTALRKVPTDKLMEIMPKLQEIVAMAQESGAPASEVGAEDVEDPALKDEGGEPKPEAKPITDSKEFQDAVTQAVLRDREVALHAKQFLDESYDFGKKSTAQIMRDALKTQYPTQTFEDRELSTAFKMLRPVESTNSARNFGDSDYSQGRFTKAGETEV